MKRALLVGIDTYDNFNGLSGCVNDVRALAQLLARNEDNSPNFACRSLSSDQTRIERRTLLEAVDNLLAPGADIGLFYFAGHGDSARNDVVLPQLSERIFLIAKYRYRTKVSRFPVHFL